MPDNGTLTKKYQGLPQPILVTTYVNPDLDGFASTLAYSEYLNKTGTTAVIKIFGDLSAETKFLMSWLKLTRPKQASSTSNFKNIVLTDTSELVAIDKSLDPNKVTEIYDHRKVHDADKFKNAAARIELVGSCATLIAEKFYHGKIDISQSSAVLLYSAIVSNTLNFKAKVTTQRDIKMAAWLKNKLKLPNFFIKKLFGSKSNLPGNKLKSALRNELKAFSFGNCSFGFDQLEMVDARKLVLRRKKDILLELKHAKQKNCFDFTFLSLIDLEKNFNIFITEDEKAQEILYKILNVKFKNNIACRPGLMMRKEIIPFIKNYLIKNS